MRWPLPGRQRAVARAVLTDWPLLRDSRGRPVLLNDNEAPRRSDGVLPGWLLLFSILLSGAIFAGAVYALCWGFVLLEAVLS